MDIKYKYNDINYLLQSFSSDLFFAEVENKLVNYSAADIVILDSFYKRLKKKKTIICFSRLS